MAASGQTRPLRATGQPYRGINVLLLWIEAQASGFVSPSWMTYRQAQALGAQVRKGETGTTVVYYGNPRKAVRDRKRVVQGKSVSVSVKLGGRRSSKKKTTNKK